MRDLCVIKCSSLTHHSVSTAHHPCHYCVISAEELSLSSGKHTTQDVNNKTVSQHEKIFRDGHDFFNVVLVVFLSLLHHPMGRFQSQQNSIETV